MRRPQIHGLLVVPKRLNDDNYAASGTPAQASTRLTSVVVSLFLSLLTTTRSFQTSCPPPKTLSLEAAVVVKQIHEKTTTTPNF
ncbi:MAG: hypothetical protein OEX10_06665 [Candidatus Bathyarchaeota archaeon]|nr:hypothetical protein [Candidatus Bathyarchaeota archaeon]MDH5663903.1 hypothetical protein [Candidatus Bathyarchaeota archaeon]